MADAPLLDAPPECDGGSRGQDAAPSTPNGRAGGSLPSRCEHQAGVDILEGLLRRPSSEVASWAVEQVGRLHRSDINIEQLPVFQLAGALNDVSQEEKQALVLSAIAGFSNLSPPMRAEALRMALRTADILKQADASELRRHLSMGQRGTEEAAKGAQFRGRVVDAAQTAWQDSPSSPSSSSFCGTPPRFGDAAHAELKTSYAYARANTEEPSSAAPALLKNALRVIKEARFIEMDQDEVAAITQEARLQGARIVQPKQLVDVVSELQPQEREQLTEALVEARVVPEEQRGVLEEALRPGGYADKLSTVLRVTGSAVKYAWVLLALPVVELLIAIPLGHLSCGVALVPWLRVDAVLSMGFTGAVCLTAHTIAPVYHKLREDPVGAVQRWQVMPEDCELNVTLEVVVPGVDFATYRAAAIGALACIGLVLLSTSWAAVGLLELLAAAFVTCAGVALLTCTLFVALRFGIAASLLHLIFLSLDDIQQHRSRQPLLGGSILPIYEEATSGESSNIFRRVPTPSPPSDPADFV